MASSFSTQQRRVLEAPGVTLVGTDAWNRPVVEKMSGIPQQLRRWAVLKSGDPVDITEPVTPIKHSHTAPYTLNTSLDDRPPVSISPKAEYRKTGERPDPEGDGPIPYYGWVTVGYTVYVSYQREVVLAEDEIVDSHENLSAVTPYPFF